MTNTLELELAIKRAGLTKREIAKRLNLSENGLYLKIDNKTEFKASELFALTKMLNLSGNEMEVIFFNQISDLQSPNDPNDAA